MAIKNGIGLCDGIAIGKICLESSLDSCLDPVLDKLEEEIAHFKIRNTDVKKELLRYENAKKIAVQQLQELAEESLNEESSNKVSDIFKAQAVLLEDQGYNRFVQNEICANLVNAEIGVTRAGRYYEGVLRTLNDDYMKERALDIKDITNRVMMVLYGDLEVGTDVEDVRQQAPEMQLEKTKAASTDEEDSSLICFSRELTPGCFMELRPQNVQAFVTQYGSAQSHAAILARSFGIPLLSGIEADLSWDGKTAILEVSGKEGKLLIDPDSDVLETYREKQEKEQKEKELLSKWKGQKTITKSGKSVQLFANINSIKELPEVLKMDAEGIGLFRSEFLFLESDDFPTEEEQLQVYKTILQTMQGKRVVIRTLDLGADKQKKQISFPSRGVTLSSKQNPLSTENHSLELQMREENPALGCRGIRFSLENPEIFRTQLRALFRASAFGNLAILYPMITSLWEIQKIKEISNSVKEELLAEGVKIGKVEEGIMIETPAAALMSDSLAKQVDFFSIGTNDLTQYTLAADRQNEGVTEFFDIHHPAVLKSIEMTAEHAHEAGIKVEICGELASDLSLTETFLSFGIDILSVVPQKILPLRKHICESDL